MDKEKILEQSRQEKDEGMVFVENKGRERGHLAFCIMFIAIVIFNFFMGQSNYTVFALFWAFIAAEAFPKYKFTGRKVYLVTVIMGGLASVLFFVDHIMQVLR